MAIPYSTSSDSAPTIEEWRDIPGYEGIYQASTEGRIRSLDRLDCKGRKRHGGIRVFSTDPYGYLFVRFHTNSHGQSIRVHVLIARTFLGERPLKYVINHIDGNPKNNKVINLEYCSHQRNIQYSHDMGWVEMSKGETRPCAKLTDTKVREIRQLLKQGVSKTRIAASYHVHPSQIIRINNREAWSHVEDEE